MTDDALAKTTFRLPKSLLKEVKQYGLDHEMTHTEVFIEALREYLGKRRTKDKPKVVDRE